MSKASAKSSSKAHDKGSKDKDASKTKSGSSKGKGSRIVDLIEAYSKKENEKTMEEITKLLGSMKTTLVGEQGAEPNQAACAALATETTQANFFRCAVEHYALFPSDTRKDIVTIFGKLLKHNNVVEHLIPSGGQSKPVLSLLIDNCQNPTLSMNCNLMLVECIRYEPLAKSLLSLPTFLPLFDLIQDANFDVGANAFGTFKELLTKHKAICATFLDANYETVFTKYRELLVSPNYVTKRTSLKLLGELLLDRSNFHVMTKYISQSSNLKLMMNLLLDTSKNIQFEAFHVFKVFVANPKKPPAILDILVKNRETLITYLTDFQNERGEDDQFVEEKQYLIKQIQSL